MCGLLGIYNLDEKIVDKSMSKKMGDQIKHRGPDGTGSYFDRGIGLIHHRLSILDVSN